MVSRNISNSRFTDDATLIATNEAETLETNERVEDVIVCQRIQCFTTYWCLKSLCTWDLLPAIAQAVVKRRTEMAPATIELRLVELQLRGLLVRYTEQILTTLSSIWTTWRGSYLGLFKEEELLAADERRTKHSGINRVQDQDPELVQPASSGREGHYFYNIQIIFVKLVFVVQEWKEKNLCTSSAK